MCRHQCRSSGILSAELPGPFLVAWGLAIDPITGNIWRIGYNTGRLTQIATFVLIDDSFESRN